jgi:hypothetical protein
MRERKQHDIPSELYSDRSAVAATVEGRAGEQTEGCFFERQFRSDENGRESEIRLRGAPASLKQQTSVAQAAR